MYGIKTSAPYTNNAPNTNPIDTGINAHCPFSPYKPECSAISIPGASNDQYEAAVITWKEKNKFFIYHRLFIHIHDSIPDACFVFNPDSDIAQKKTFNSLDEIVFKAVKRVKVLLKMLQIQVLMKIVMFFMYKII